MKSTLVVFCPLYPPSVGGLQNHAEQWNREMVKLGHDVTVFTPRVAGGSHREVTLEGVTILRFPAFELIPNWPVPKIWRGSFWRSLRAIAVSSRQQAASTTIVVSRTRFFTTSLVALLFSRWRKLPWLHIEHGSDYVQLENPALQMLAKLYDHTLGRLVLHSATKIVANSKASAAFVKKLSGREAKVIYRGIDVEKIDQIRPAKIRTSPHPSPTLGEGDKWNITYAGRLIDGKGVADLLQAFAKLVTSHRSPAPTLLIVGDGPQRAALERLVQRLSLADSVHFLGEKSWEETIAVLKNSDVFVNPSYTEGLPSSVVEAVLCGCRVVATDVGGTREIPGVTLVPPRAPKQLATSIDEILREPSSIATDAARQQFSWTTSAQRYDQELTHIP